MARPRADGLPPREPTRKNLTEALVGQLKPEAKPFVVRDTKQRGLAILVHPSGKKSWKATYAFHGRPRWFHIGEVGAISLTDARRLAGKVVLAVAEGKDPHGDRLARRGAGTFQELAERYREEWAKKRNKSWQQADALVRTHVLPRWAKMQASTITRGDVKRLMSQIAAPILANQVLASTSAVFSWAVKEELVPANPCSKVDRNETRARERILSDSEIKALWPRLSPALKLVLLTGQRPGEVAHMHRSHVVDGWWTLPGGEVKALEWPGTKNGQTHRVFLSKPVLEILAELPGEGRVFSGGRVNHAMRIVLAEACRELGLDHAVAHDLRRTFSTMVTRLRFGRDAMNRVTNHRTKEIADVYDRHGYQDDDRKIMETVAELILQLAEGREKQNVIPMIKA
jgi:integrase